MIFGNYERKVFTKYYGTWLEWLTWGSTNLLCCLVQGVSTSTCLSCDKIGTGELEVSVAAQLLLSGSILLASGEATGVLGTVAGLTGVSGI